jgi:phospholipase/carboxylesterase
MSAALIDWAKAQGADVQTYIHNGGHDLQQGEIAALKELFTGAETQ